MITTPELAARSRSFQLAALRTPQTVNTVELLAWIAGEIESANRLLTSAPIWDDVTRIKLAGRIEAYIIVRAYLLGQAVETEAVKVRIAN